MPWLIGLLAVSVGLPFFALSATSPLLQRWFGETAHDAARDPYFLYGASNLGSLLALVAYPLVLEPNLALAEQSNLWTFAYVVLAIAIGGAGCFTLYRGRVQPNAPRRIERPTHPVLGSPTWRMRLDWVLFAFVPSGLLVAVTTFITTDLVAVPLFWWSRSHLYPPELRPRLRAPRRSCRRKWLLAAQVPLLITAALIATWNATQVPLLGPGPDAGDPLRLGDGSATAAGAAPPASAQYLTEFYVWMSLGGILGSAFAALLAPLVFDRVIELLILCAGAALLRPAHRPTRKSATRAFRSRPSAMLREVSFPSQA
jgi:hypothetical protein